MRPERLIPFHSLRIEELSLPLHVGVESGERSLPQEMRFRVEFRFRTVPEAVRTDELSHTICYGKVAGLMKEKLGGREFRLIEHLAGETYFLLREFFPGPEIAVEVRKVFPPVEGLLGGAIYRCGDFP